MKKFFKFCITLVVISAIIAIGSFISWAVASVFVARYLFKLQGKYENPKDCLKEWKNIVAIVSAVILFVVIPFSYYNWSKEYDKEQKLAQEQQLLLEQKEKEEAEKEEQEKARVQVLNAKSKIKKMKKDGKDYTRGIELTKKEIEEYDITDEEIYNFNEDVEKAIIALEEEEFVKKYKIFVNKYVRDNATHNYPDVTSRKYSFNEDRTICTFTGTYKAKNEYGANVRGEFIIEMDTSSGEVISQFMGNEKVTR